jgi:hypothetical protein
MFTLCFFTENEGIHEYINVFIIKMCQMYFPSCLAINRDLLIGKMYDASLLMLSPAFLRKSSFDIPGIKILCTNMIIKNFQRGSECSGTFRTCVSFPMQLGSSVSLLFVYLYFKNILLI